MFDGSLSNLHYSLEGKANNPAFPFKVAEKENINFVYPGISKREYFAASAMTGVVNSGYYIGTAADLASHSVALADALIKELNKKK